MSKVRDLIRDSMMQIGVLALGETPTASDANDALRALNRMISSWSNERLTVTSTVRETFALTPGQGSYTFGTGGNFNSARPIDIETATLRMTNSGQAIDYPLEKITQEEYERIALKSFSSQIPTKFFMDGAYPLQTIYFYGVPSAAASVIFNSWKEITQFASLDTELVVQPGMEEALLFNLAIKLAPLYGRQTPEEVIAGAVAGKENIKRANYTPKVMGTDPAFLMGQRKSFNIISGN